MKKIIFVCMLVLFGDLILACSEKSDSDDEVYTRTEKVATGGEDNEDSPNPKPTNP